MRFPDRNDPYHRSTRARCHPARQDAQREHEDREKDLIPIP
jgi:hypothetical protein